MTVEKIFTTINGVEQGMIMQYDDISKPVLLFLHGGPGSTSFTLFEKYHLQLHTLFVVCFWEQRGAGISYNKNIDPETMNATQIIDDAVCVTEFLLERYQQERIFLMGHSWGSFIGIQLASLRPDLFYSYIGVGQVNNQFASERAAYDYLLSAATAAGNQKDRKKLLAFNPDSPDFPTMKYMSGPRSLLLNKYHVGLSHTDISMLKDFFWPIIRSNVYTFSEKIKQVRGMIFSSRMFAEVLTTTISDVVKSLEIPAYFISGVYDYQTSYVESKKLFDSLTLPSGAFIQFEHSAHCPLFEEPDRFFSVVEEIVADTLSQ